MKFFTSLFSIVLGLLLFSPILFSQYDDGTVIYSESDESNLKSILYNYAVFDFDGDDFADIVSVIDGAENSPHQISWFKSDEIGNFSAQEIISEVNNLHKNNEIFYADMNEDDIEDIIFQNSETGFTIFLNDGEGNISDQIEIVIEAEEIVGADLKEIADLDGDGDMDCLFFAKIDSSFYNNYFGHCLIAYNNGSGAFTSLEYLDNSDPEIFVMIDTGDFDGDGDLDVISSGHGHVRPNGGFGPASFENPFLRFYENAGPANFLDKVEINLPTFTIIFPVTEEVEPSFTNIKVADINKDGIHELLAEFAFRADCEEDLHLQECHYQYQFHVMAYNADDGLFENIEAYDSWLHDYGLKANFSNYYEFYDEAFHFQIGHYNEDNNLDILSVNVPQGKLFWHLGNGTGDFTDTDLVNTNNQYSNNRPALRSADIDNDTDLDLFVLINSESSSELIVYKNLSPNSSIDEMSHFKNKIAISPNPVLKNSYIHIALLSNISQSNLNYAIINLKGETVANGKIGGSKIVVPNVPLGIYLLEIAHGDEKHFKKIIIE